MHTNILILIKKKQIKNGNNVVSVRENQQQMSVFLSECDYIERQNVAHMLPYSLMVFFVSLSSFQLINDFTFQIWTRNAPEAYCVFVFVFVRIFDDIPDSYYYCYYDSYHWFSLCSFLSFIIYGECVRMNRIEMQLSNTRDSCARHCWVNSH